jgi:PLP dependent protein
VRERWPDADRISAGMSGDLEEAVAHGATQVRIGGAVLGQRPSVQ